MQGRVVVLCVLLAGCQSLSEESGGDAGTSTSTSTTTTESSTSGGTSSATTATTSSGETTASETTTGEPTTDGLVTSGETGLPSGSSGPGPRCGDGNVDPDEGCDDGEQNSDAAPDACRTNCQPAACGDGVVDGDEACDDANLDPEDGCAATCSVELGFACTEESPSECGPASILINGGFEDSSRGDPIVTGRTFPEFPGTELWFADLSAFVPAEAGIVPDEGVQMLRFDAAGAEAGGNTVSNVQQVIDLEPYRTLIAEGRVTLEAGALFNRVDTAVDSSFQIRLWAYSGSVDDGFTELVGFESSVLADLQPATWEDVNVTLPLPPESTFAVISLNAIENVEQNGSPPEFAGHFADSADVRIVVAPSG